MRGVSNGTWRKQEYILETASQYPKKVCFMAWGDKIDEFSIKKGESLVVSVDLESREYNGRWYTDVKAGKFHVLALKTSLLQIPKRYGCSLLIDHLDDDIPLIARQKAPISSAVCNATIISADYCSTR